MSDTTFFEQKKARSILVDSESKVISSICGSKAGHYWKPESVFYEYAGRGNNWAYGYYDLKGSKRHQKSIQKTPSTAKSTRRSVTAPLITELKPSILSTTMDAIRREAEAADFFSGVVMTHSIAGGTGSGLGSHLVEDIKDQYPHHPLLSVSIAPFQGGGETPLQSYNSLLTLTWLQQYTDGIILFQNGQLMKSLSSIFAKTNPSNVDAKGQYRLSLSEVNLYIANAMAGLFLPTAPADSTKNGSFNLMDLITCVCPVHNLKFMELNTFPFVTNVKKKPPKSLMTWRDVTNGLLSTTCRYTRESIARTVTARVIVRGASDDFSPSSMMTQIQKGHSIVRWNDRPLQVQAKYEAGAYLHWYHQHGLEEDTLVSSFETMRRIMDDYETFTLET
ncbi:hypothetical protein PROFUN_09255 [Planoprotostelium fungivorum]|uniref:Tubulin/FtsZ GTPase domain-containing protein n=1 Tax=Planoprotostelium fungivorum TaxID=1890364 RepID=A0A2P6NL00_9EUKA|nr:hypothetical protein PROFUN_09255 [Planoprotostelium fungivorum]